MLHSNHPSKCLLYAALLCTAVATNAAQEKNESQAQPSVGVMAAADSDTAQIEAAPGVPLPAKGMVWILDQTENKPQLARIFLSHIHPNGHRAENVVRAQFLVLRMDSSMELPGIAAKLRVNSHTPAIFIRKSQEEEEEMQSAPNGKNVQEHYVLLRLHLAGDVRVVCTFTAWEFGLKQNRHEDIVEASIEEVAAGEWLKITPKQPIPDGEYAVVHMPDDKRYFESNAYDFGIGAAAINPANK